MSLEKIKQGDACNILATFVKVDEDGDFVFLVNGIHQYFSAEEAAKNVSPIAPPPKHDPCRPFREGDIVEPCAVNGRWCSHVWEDRSGIHYEVAKDEDPLTAHMEVKDPDSPYSFLAHAAFFKLVAPVEEPYCISAGAGIIEIWKRKSEVVKTWYYDEVKAGLKAKAAAKAECDRLNAEWRKEQNNG